MAAVLVPTGSVTFVSEVQIGTVYVYVTITWDQDVQLSGVPALVLSDGLGNDYLPEKAAPHITDLADLVPFTRFRFNSVPRFDTLTITVPGSVPGISTPGGSTTAPGAYPVVSP